MPKWIRQPGTSWRVPILAVCLAGGLGVVVARAAIVAQVFYDNLTGRGSTFSTHSGGVLDFENPFFDESIGLNGRACIICHRLPNAWSLAPDLVGQLFDDSDGTGPLFRKVDGATSPLADVSTTEARRTAYALLLSKALIRTGLPMPASADFTLQTVEDPYGYASAAELSLFRRPLPAANLPFVRNIMWDGREPDLPTQAGNAILTHAAAAEPAPSETVDSIVAYAATLFTAQAVDAAAGDLALDGARGGPVSLSTQLYFHGINDPRQPLFNPRVFDLYDGWTAATGPNAAARQAIARGQGIFANRQFNITPALRGTCGTCHNAPNVGHSSLGLFIDLGTSAPEVNPDLPVYTLRCTLTGRVVKTTDPGRALITGKCRDIGKFKVPSLRGLAARPPYFHSGSAATLEDAVIHHDTRFSIGLTAQERADLVAFLSAL